MLGCCFKYLLLLLLLSLLLLCVCVCVCVCVCMSFSDPFGHSATQASVLSAAVGFTSLFFARIDYQVGESLPPYHYISQRATLPHSRSMYTFSTCHPLIHSYILHLSLLLLLPPSLLLLGQGSSRSQPIFGVHLGAIRFIAQRQSLHGRL